MRTLFDGRKCMYVLANYGNARLQSLTLRRISPPPARTIDATNPWEPNFDPETNTKKVPEQPKTARIFAEPLVLNGAGSGAEWEIRARVTSPVPALLVITVMHEQTRNVACSFEANASGGAQTTAVRFTE
jgi:hypothetical protein